MIVLDVNVLIYAHRADDPLHARHAAWVRDLVRSLAEFSIPSVVATGFVRIVTHPRIYDPPSPLRRALRFIASLRDRPNHVPLEPGPGHWAVFRRLCIQHALRGADVSDAHLAAICLESGAELISTDRGFARFPGLRWREPAALGGAAGST